tara:strand:+ start:663 stop:767 length:105 start_codon:yes stop_codon:yes gene_type:complete
MLCGDTFGEIIAITLDDLAVGSNGISIPKASQQL